MVLSMSWKHHRAIDQEYLGHPYSGSRCMAVVLGVNRK
jgi:hypothetical protein